MRKALPTLIIFMLLCSIFTVFMPRVNAALPPCCYTGKVVGKNVQSNAIAIQVEYEWRGGDWAPYSGKLEGTAPVHAMNEIDIGDYVEAVSLGIPGNQWVVLGKMKSSIERVIPIFMGIQHL